MPQQPDKAVGSGDQPEPPDPCICIYCGRRLAKPLAAKSHMRYCKSKAVTSKVLTEHGAPDWTESVKRSSDHTPSDHDNPPNVTKLDSDALPDLTKRAVELSVRP